MPHCLHCAGRCGTRSPPGARWVSIRGWAERRRKVEAWRGDWERRWKLGSEPQTPSFFNFMRVTKFSLAICLSGPVEVFICAWSCASPVCTIASRRWNPRTAKK